MKCWAEKCTLRARHEDHVYCDAHWTRLTAKLRGLVHEIGRDARYVYVGRTAHPERRLLEHYNEWDRDHLSVLHWSCNARETTALEHDLIGFVLEQFPMKKDNEEHSSRGKWGGQWNALYVSWSWRAKSEREIRARLVADLGGRSLAPVDGELANPVHLRVAWMRPERAKELVEEWYADRRALRDRRL